MNEEAVVDRPEPQHTHKAVVTVYSNGPQEVINVKVHWEPNMDGKAIEELGYFPPAYSFIQEYVVPAIEEAMMDWGIDPLLKADSPSQYKN